MARCGHGEDVTVGGERFFRPGYVANLVSSWIPAIEGLAERLQRGIRVADVGCGLGSSTRILAETFPASRVVGDDNDVRSIELANRLAADAGLADRVGFTVPPLPSSPGTDLGFVATFDCLHDRSDPVAAARHVRAALAKGVSAQIAGVSPAERHDQHHEGATAPARS